MFRGKEEPPALLTLPSDHAKAYEIYLSLSDNALKRIFSELSVSLSLGLNGRNDMMNETFVNALPSGEERGCGVGVTLGADSLSATFATFHGSGKIEIVAESIYYPFFQRSWLDRGGLSVGSPKSETRCKYGPLQSRSLQPKHSGQLQPKLSSPLQPKQSRPLRPKQSMPLQPKRRKTRDQSDLTATALFDIWTSLVSDVCPRDGAAVGMSAAFPMEHRGLQSARLLSWIKGLSIGRRTEDPVEGSDLGVLLDLAFWRQGLKHSVCGVCNDAVSLMLCACYEKPPGLPPVEVAVIVGGGFNVCYREPQALSCGYSGQIISTEVGNCCRELPFIDVDEEIDFYDSAAPKRRRLEKMVGSDYLGEIVRLIIIKAWKGDAPRRAWTAGSLPTFIVLKLAEDESDHLIVTYRLLKAALSWSVENPLERLSVRSIARAVFKRSARLAGASLAAVLYRLESLAITIAFNDTAIVREDAGYQLELRRAIACLLGQRALVKTHFLVIEGGDRKGACILACKATD